MVPGPGLASLTAPSPPQAPAGQPGGRLGCPSGGEGERTPAGTPLPARRYGAVHLLHLAAYPGVGEALLEAGTTGVAYETVQLDNGSLPLLAPMSEIAGRLPPVGAHLLERPRRSRRRSVVALACNRRGLWFLAPARSAGMPPTCSRHGCGGPAADRSPERLRSRSRSPGRLMSVVSSPDYGTSSPCRSAH